MGKLKFKIRFWLYLALFCFIIFILYKAILPLGKATYVFTPGVESFNFGKISPVDRVKPPQQSNQEIIGNPVYFSLRTLRRFEKARLTLEYRNEKMPIIEAGVLTDGSPKRYALKPIENKIIDSLGSWAKISENGLTFLQKEKKYNSIDDFLKNLPDNREIGVYNYDLKNNFILSGYKKSDKINSYETPIKGYFQFYTYIKNENLNFDFNYQDNNRITGKDDIVVNIYDSNKLVRSFTKEDDGNITDNAIVMAGNNLKINIPDLPEGAYKVEFKAGDDIIVNQIKTSQSKLSFIEKVYFAEKNEPLVIYTDSRMINAETINPKSLGKIKINKDELNLDKTYKLFSLKNSEEIAKIEMPKRDLFVAGDGVFGFSKESLFNPKIKKINENTDVAKENLKYIISGYSEPSKGEYSKASADFDLSPAYRENQKYGFILSIPGLDAESGKEKVIIKSVRIDLEGKTFIDKIKEIYGKLKRKL